jgi:hypothetical protein
MKRKSTDGHTEMSQVLELSGENFEVAILKMLH